MRKNQKMKLRKSRLQLRRKKKKKKIRIVQCLGSHRKSVSHEGQEMSLSGAARRSSELRPDHGIFQHEGH